MSVSGRMNWWPSETQLRNGQLVIIPPILVRRLKSHFITLPCGVDLILGLNGYIWVSKHVKDSDQEGEEGFDAEAVYSNRNDVSEYRFLCDVVNVWLNRPSTTPPGLRSREWQTLFAFCLPTSCPWQTLCSLRHMNGLLNRIPMLKVFYKKTLVMHWWLLSQREDKG